MGKFTGVSGKNYLEGSGIIKELDHQGSVFLYSEDSGWAARFSRIANPLLFLTRIHRSRMPVEVRLSCAEGKDSGQGIKGYKGIF